MFSHDNVRLIITDAQNERVSADELADTRTKSTGNRQNRKCKMMHRIHSDGLVWRGITHG